MDLNFPEKEREKKNVGGGRGRERNPASNPKKKKCWLLCVDDKAVEVDKNVRLEELELVFVNFSWVELWERGVHIVKL